MPIYLFQISYTRRHKRAGIALACRKKIEGTVRLADNIFLFASSISQMQLMLNQVFQSVYLSGGGIKQSSLSVMTGGSLKHEEVCITVDQCFLDAKVLQTFSFQALGLQIDNVASSDSFRML